MTDHPVTKKSSTNKNKAEMSRKRPATEPLADYYQSSSSKRARVDQQEQPVRTLEMEIIHKLWSRGVLGLVHDYAGPPAFVDLPKEYRNGAEWKMPFHDRVPFSIPDEKTGKHRFLPPFVIADARRHPQDLYERGFQWSFRRMWVRSFIVAWLPFDCQCTAIGIIMPFVYANERDGIPTEPAKHLHDIPPSVTCHVGMDLAPFVGQDAKTNLKRLPYVPSVLQGQDQQYRVFLTDYKAVNTLFSNFGNLVIPYTSSIIDSSSMDRKYLAGRLSITDGLAYVPLP